MERLIEADKLLENQYIIDDSATLSTRNVVNVEDIEEAPTVEAIPKADYENRLKADLVAMLEEFDLELSEYEDADLIRVEYIRQDIQEKINALKGEENVDKT